MRHAIRPFLLTTLIGTLLLAGSTGVARADDSLWKSSNDTDPHLPLTLQQLQMTAAKRSVECGGGCGGGGLPPNSAHVAANQTSQSKNYFCGPAAVHEALDALGISLTQTAAAAALRTSTTGTAWSGGGTKPSGYPVPDVMNAYQKQNFYVPQPVGTSPTSQVVSTYEKDLATNIAALRVPLIGDAWETSASDHHLVGHPTDRTILHWFEIRGYDDSGATTLYEDSVHGATSVSWYAGVPAYSSLPSTWIVSIVGGRGYVW